MPISDGVRLVYLPAVTSTIPEVSYIYIPGILLLFKVSPAGQMNKLHNTVRITIAWASWTYCTCNSCLSFFYKTFWKSSSVAAIEPDDLVIVGTCQARPPLVQGRPWTCQSLLSQVEAQP